MTTIRRLGRTRPDFSMACAPAAPTTPGRVQPGNGSWRSWEPVATSSRAGVERAGPVPAVGPGDRVQGPVRCAPLDGPDVVAGEMADPACRAVPVEPCGEGLELPPVVVKSLGPGGAEAGCRGTVVLAARCVRRVEQDHIESAVGSGDGGGRPGGTGAHHREFGALGAGGGRFSGRDRHDRPLPAW